MPAFILDLFRALTTPNGSASGELLSTRRKSHLLQAEWYARIAAAGEAEREAATPRQGTKQRAATADTESGDAPLAHGHR